MLETNGKLDRNLLKELGTRRLLSKKYVIFILICAAVCLVGAVLTGYVHDYAYCFYFIVLTIVFIAVIPLATSSLIKRQMNLIRETTGTGYIEYHVVADDDGLHVDNIDTKGHVNLPYAVIAQAFVSKSAIVIVTNARQMIPMFPSETLTSDDIAAYLTEKGIPISR